MVAVQILFNWIGPNVNQQPFQLRVWNDNNGLPGTQVYEDVITSPNYQYVYNQKNGNLTNAFYPYVLQSKVKLSGTFYVGFVQYTSPTNTLLNVGFDRNTNSNNKMFYKTDNFWQQATIPGSLMMRPVFGTLHGMVPIAEITHPSPIILYPNPSSGTFTVALNDIHLQNNNLLLRIFSGTGKVVHQQMIQSHTTHIQLPSFSKGIYFVRITGKNDFSWNQKLVITE
jgi:hypothetical protein